MNKKYIVDNSVISTSFTRNVEKEDETLIELLKDAYSGKLLVQLALLKVEAIHPFSDFTPQISPEFKQYFEDLEKQGTPPPLYVYPKENVFIMSDDYNAYQLFKEKGYKAIMCIVLGSAEGDSILEKGELFQLPLPTISDLSE